MTETKSATEVWEDIYKAASPQTSGQPGRLVRRFTEDMTAGRALELGCGKGDDAVWLARQGWQVTAVDISNTALGYAADNARRAGVAEQIVFEQHDLAQSFPEGRFELVLASFLHSSVDFPRARILRKAADAVAPGGFLLIVEHASRAPWSWSTEGTVFPTAEETLASMELDAAGWQRRFVEAESREAKGPDGQTATVLDNVVFLQRAA